MCIRDSPDDDDRAQGDFGQGVEHHQIGLGDFGEKGGPPEQDRQPHPQPGAQQKADQRLVAGDADM